MNLLNIRCNNLSAFDDLNLFQLVNFSTIWSGNTLGLFWSTDPRRFLVYRQRKPIPIAIQFWLICKSLVMIVLHLMSQSKCIQRRVLTRNIFCLLIHLFTKLFSNSQKDFLSIFDVSIKAALNDSCPKKS